MKLSNCLILTSSALAVSLAYAADNDASSENIHQVTVTAQKRPQTTIDVAQSLSVITGDTLEKQQATGFADYVKMVPSLQLVQSTPGSGRLVLRGLDTGGVASTVAIYLDETPFGSSSGLVNGAALAGDFDTFDMARVEVLRGPQGALYGASSLGGLVKFVTNLPETDRFLMRVRVGAAVVDGGSMAYKSSVVVNQPISDTMALRVSGSYNTYPGSIDSIGTGGSDRQNNIDSSRNYGGRASLLIAPNKDFSLRLTATGQNIAADAPTAVESDPQTLATLYGRQTQSQFVPQFRDINYRIYNGTAIWNLGSASLTSSTSYSTQKQTMRDDVTFNLSGLIETVFGTPNELTLPQNTNLKKFTQELRLSSSTPGMFDWLAGLYYTDEDGSIAQRYAAVTPGTLSPVTSLPKLAEVNLGSNYREVAAFANTTVHLGEHYDLDIGGRYSHNKQNANQTTDGVLAGGASTNQASSSENVFTYAVAPKWKLSDRMSLYARAAKGYRPGGPNILPPNAPDGTPATYHSDSVLSYETGFKSISADGVLAFDISAFHVKWKDIQLLAVVNGFGVNTNGVGATSDGVEFTATFRPINKWRLSANGAYNNARLDGSTSPLVGGVEGDKLPFSPKYTLGLSSDYRWVMGATTPAYVGVSVRHVSERSGSFDNAFRTTNARQRELPSYNVVDAHFGVELGDWTLEAYGKNLTNSDGKISTSTVQANGGNQYPNGAISTGVITPRTVGLTLTREY
jgi:outer membrane receptor protein involved in Fe transport